MKLVVQRVTKASVHVGSECVGRIGKGLFALLAVSKEDTPETCKQMAEKLCHLRIFSDHHGMMQHHLLELSLELLVVSQFTLLGDTSKGRRPEFLDAALPEQAFLLYEKFLQDVQSITGKNPQQGRFGANMQVELVNDGPVTLILEK